MRINHVAGSGVCSRRCVGRATLFVSSALEMSTKEFFEVLIAELGDEDFAYIELFVYPQFGVRETGADGWMKRVNELIVRIGKVLGLGVVAGGWKFWESRPPGVGGGGGKKGLSSSLLEMDAVRTSGASAPAAPAAGSSGSDGGGGTIYD